MQKIVGLDIGSYSIKAAVIKSSYRSFELVDFYELKYPKEYFTETNEEKKNEIRVLGLRKLFSNYLLKADQTIASVPGNNVSMKIVSMPFKEKKKIERTIGFEIESYIPFDLDEILFDYQIISSSKEKSDILVGIVRKEFFSSYFDLFRKGAVDPRTIEIDSLSLSNLANLLFKDKEEDIAIIDIGHKKTNVCVVGKGVPQFTRTIIGGGYNITNRIEKAYNISFEQAEELKQKKGYLRIEMSDDAGDDEKDLVNTIKLAVDPIVNELMQTIRSYESSSKRKVKEIYFCGGTYRLRNLPQYISAVLGIKSYPLKYLEGEYNKLENVHGKASIIPQSFALALSGINHFRRSKINFRKEEFAYRKDIKDIRGSVIKYLIMIFAILVLALINSITNYSINKERVDDIHQAIRKTFYQVVPEMKKQSIAPKKVITILNGRITKAKEVTDSLGKGGLSKLDILKEVSARIPTNIKVDVKELNIGENKVKISGTIDSIESVDKIITNLQEFTQFENVEKGSVTTAAGGESKRFDITFTVSQMGADKEGR